jgi:hypothetical protein
MNNTRHRECCHRNHLEGVNVKSSKHVKLSEACMKYEYGCGGRSALSDPRKSDNPKGDEEQDRQQGHRNGHRMKFCAQIGTGCCRGDSGGSYCIQEGRCRPNESQQFP